MTNHLYFGDNLEILRHEIANESVDLIYLDPPFNSQATYNALFHAPASERSPTQIEAFEDTWHWNQGADQAFNEAVTIGNENTVGMLRAMRSFLKENDMMAYLAMMAVRLIELHRVLKPTGTLYLHCDTTASHYLKILLDAVFGPINFRNEISWKRSNPKSHGYINFPNCRDIIFRFTKTDHFIFNKIYSDHNQEYIESAYKYKDENGRLYRLLPLLNPNDNRPNLTYEFLGVTRVWRWTKERMQKAYDDGLVVQLKPGAVPQYKKYLDESPGRTITNDWDDIRPIGAGEELGYPTQKPVALLERIINVSSNPGDLVLDPFCGCGTAVHAAEKLERRWIGIDITHLAISLIEKRLHDAFPTIAYELHGTPKDLSGAKALATSNKTQFQWWAVSLVNAIPYAGYKNGRETYIHGLIYLKSHPKTIKKVVVSVTDGALLCVRDIYKLSHMIEHEQAEIGIFLTLTPPTELMKSEAEKMGHYESEFGKFPKIQIITIAELLAGGKPQIPLVDTSPFKRTKAEDVMSKKQGKLF